MPTDLIVSVSDMQLRVLRQLDATKTARQVLQVHVDTWLAPLVQTQDATDRKAVTLAYQAATPQVQAQVKGLLGLG